MLVCRVYRSFVLTLAAVALAPLLVGCSPYLVRSGSMEPTVGVGDIVIGQPVEARRAPVLGRVMVFVNPARTDGELLVHRVIERRDDGSYTTQGDHNLFPDSTPVQRSDFRSRAVLLAPYVGLPVVWWNDGDLGLLLLWMLLTVAAFVLARSPRRPEDPEDPEGPDGRQDRRRHRGVGRRRRWINVRPRSLPAAHMAHARPRRRSLASVGVLGVAGALLVFVGGSAGASFTARSTNGSNGWTVGAWQQPYVKAVLADKPWVFYPLDEASGTWATDESGNDRTGQFTTIGSYRAAGALPNNFGYAVNLGSGGRVVASSNPIAAPNTFSLEAWFKTSTTAGGPIVSFGNTRDSYPILSDRQLAMSTSGRLVFGAWASLSQRTITSPKAYNDNRWHHVVLTSSGNGSTQTSVMYVDGAQVVSGSTTATSAITGWWRFGAGVSSTLGVPVTSGFAGSLDQVAVYTSTLGAARVAAHYNAR